MQRQHAQLGALRHLLPRFGPRRRKDPAARIGHGTAWLVHDAARDCFHCYWLVGQPNEHLIEHATEATAANAVQWARSRTPRARIRLADHRTYWAGTEPAPPGFAGTWPAARDDLIQPDRARGWWKLAHAESA